MSRVKAHDPVLEGEVVATLLDASIDSAKRRSMLLRVDADHFSPRNTTALPIWKYIRKHYAQHQRMIDSHMLLSSPQTSPALLQAINDLPPRLRGLEQFENALETLSAYRQKRTLLNTVDELTALLAKDTYDPDEVAAKLQHAVCKVARPAGMSETMLNPRDPQLHRQVQTLLQQIKETQKRRWPTGWPTIDKMMSGGVAPAEILLLAANTGGGKSMAALSMAMHMAERGANVCYFAFEMSLASIMARVASREAGHTRAELAGDSMTPAQVAQAAHTFVKAFSQYGGSLRLLTPDRSFAKPELAYIENIVTRRPTDVVFVDYMSMVAGNVDRNSNEEQRLRFAAEGLVMLGASTQTAIVAMAQLGETGDIKYSKGIKNAVTTAITWDSSAVNERMPGSYLAKIIKKREQAGDCPDEFWLKQNYDNLRIDEDFTVPNSASAALNPVQQALNKQWENA